MDIWRCVLPPCIYPSLLTFVYAGGFQDGDSSMNPGDSVVARSIALGEPVVYVSINYRLSGTTISPYDDEPSSLAPI